jgi:hypothetical protein
MPIEHIEHIVAGEEHRDNTLVRVLTSKVSKLEKLQEARMQAIETNGI